MSSHEKIPSNLNLLQKQHSVNEIENRFEIKYESLSVETYEENHDDSKTNLILTLTKWQMDENSICINYESLWREYELLKKNVECIYHYFACTKLATKASKEVADMIINLDISKSSIEAVPEIENDNLEKNILELIHDNDIRAAWNELECRKKDYDIATKNFKILLEIIEFEIDELNNLKQQFDDVFSKYQNARYEIEKNLPTLLEKMKELFCSCLQSLSGNVEEMMKATVSLDDLIKNDPNQLEINKLDCN